MYAIRSYYAFIVSIVILNSLKFITEIEFEISPKRLPIVSTGKLNIFTTTVAPTNAINEPGIVLLTFGQNTIISKEAIPTQSVAICIDEMCEKYAPHFSKNSDGTLSIFKPKKSFICVENKTTAILV